MNETVSVIDIHDVNAINFMQLHRMPAESATKIYSGLGKAIRVRRKALGLTQEDLAGRIGLTRTSVTNIEKGRQKIQIHTLFEIAAALRINAQALLPSSDVSTQQLPETARGLNIEQRRFVKSVLSSPDTGAKNVAIKKNSGSN